MNKKTIGLIIKDLRTKNKMKQKDVAQAIGVTSAAISDYEVGKSNPSDEKIELLATLFKVPIDFFYEKQKTSKLNLNQVPEMGDWKEEIKEEIRAMREKMQDEIDFYRNELSYFKDALKEAHEQLRAKDRFIENLFEKSGKPKVSKEPRREYFLDLGAQVAVAQRA
ncbi:DNA-binding transcriptional regulator, XRE-family HTH domain [Flexibacter flexilis DSM 6793]|uniref:DNA-binding transcriptional regulator, XRE-family HTH domain n=1 Tax=Flexibacter flexilis DSM 6793 TaxID=927664 RepID=A0A1I1M8S2_9BACT|nr:helix-turn-helix transcriptional regulator [Flexibacter flexilis]SFC81754.1 DNA-binding transcriptional regulator, XRE-family HTH domain [Flexibacter flexilis DSM 6793]